MADISQEFLEGLKQAGVTPEQIEAAMRVVHADAYERLLAKRATDRARQRRYREKVKQNQQSNNVAVTVTSRDNNVTPSPSSSPLSSPPDKERTKEINPPYNPPIITPSPISCRFDEFWALYPRKQAKRDAQKAWQQALRKGISEDLMLNGLSVYQFSPDPAFHPLPASWIRGERWMDERNNVISTKPAKLTQRQKIIRHNLELGHAFATGQLPDPRTAASSARCEVEILPALGRAVAQDVPQDGRSAHARTTHGLGNGHGELF